MVSSIAVIGGGIAGISAACYLARHPAAPKVTLIEKERTLKYHTSGRSIAQLDFGYGHKSIQSLTARSFEIFKSIADSHNPNVLQKQMMLCLGLGSEDDEAIAAVLRDFPDASEISVERAVELFPYLRAETLHRVALAPNSFNIDVDLLFDYFKASLIQAGGTIATATRLDSARKNLKSGSRWIVETTSGPLEADLLINAAGAWGDDVAIKSGIEPLGLTSHRRTVVSVENRFEQFIDPNRVAPMLTRSTFKHWYLKIVGRQVYCSLSEEILAEPGDPKPTLDDVKLTKRRVEAVVDGISINPQTAIHDSWVGLRTFSPDRLVVVGPDPADETFFWYVGQGGNGIQAAPAAAELIASLALSETASDSLDPNQVDPEPLSPARFR